jgi:N-hydroxyarylamine O-acetyltransferase
MTASSFDQQAWLKRIGYGGPLEPTLGTLRQFIFAHSHAIAYESLDIMPLRTPKLDVGALQRKMIFGGHGGYCLEQNAVQGRSPVTGLSDHQLAGQGRAWHGHRRSATSDSYVAAG